MRGRKGGFRLLEGDVLKNLLGFAWYPLYADFWESLAVLRNPPGFARYPLYADF